MGQEIAQRVQHPSPAEAQHMMRCLPPFKGSRPATVDEAQETRAAIDRLSVPVTSNWLNGRIATLLSHFWVLNMPAPLMEAAADDWHETLAEYPAWAIANACRWWISAANPRHGFKPTPGQIEARVREETAPIRGAEILLGLGVQRAEPQPEREVITAEVMAERREAAARIIAETFGARDAQ